MFEFDDSTAGFFDKTSVLETMNVPLDIVSKDHKTNTMGYWLIDTCIKITIYL